MANLEVAYRRLANQQLVQPGSTDPAEVVKHLGAVQSQDYRPARWALGMRVKGATEATIEQALNEGKILRTHVLRPTWHYVVPEDIRWMLALTGKRVEKAAANFYKQVEIGPETFKVTDPLIEKSLQGGKHLTKAEIGRIIIEAGIDVSNQLRLSHTIFHAELLGLICSGARQGNNITFTLLEERVAPAPDKTREEAVIELARRYFTSHGPATVPDFAWWSGLPAADARFALDALKTEIFTQTFEGQTFYSIGQETPAPDFSDTLFLVPNYDEYIVSYKNRSDIEDLTLKQDLASRRNYVFNHAIISNGVLAGLWKRDYNSKKITVTYEPFREFSAHEIEKLNSEAGRMGQFLEVPVAVEPGKVVSTTKK